MQEPRPAMAYFLALTFQAVVVVMGAVQEFPRSAIAVEASGSYSWLVDEMKRSGHYPRLCNQRGLAGRHVVRLYQRIKRAKNHQKAVVAVARHLAEAAWWILTKQEVYREPSGSRQALSSTHG
jgi:hypothetical protein